MKCICGHPCRAALFSSYEGCTNPKCKWFDNEVIRAAEAAKDMLKKAGAGTMLNTISYFVEHATRIAREHGWGWTEEEKAGVLSGKSVHRLLSELALVHSEVSEAVEAARDEDFAMRRWPTETKPEGMVVELADAVIRIMHLCGELGLPLEEAIVAKMKYNEQWTFKHGGKLA